MRVDSGASPKTVNLEIGTLRAILKRSGQWARLQPDVKMLATRDDVGRAITPEEEAALLQACGRSRSRSLVPFVTLAIETGARFGVIRTLQCGSVDFENRCLRWGKDKTASGTGRIIPLTSVQWPPLASGRLTSRSGSLSTMSSLRSVTGPLATCSPQRHTTQTYEAHRQYQGSMGSGEAKSGEDIEGGAGFHSKDCSPTLPLSRSPAHGCIADAECGGSHRQGCEDRRMEYGDNGSHGSALRTLHVE
jgi:integrase